MQGIPIQARTSSGQSGALLVGDPGTTLNVTLTVTGISGVAAALDVEVQWSPDGSTWAVADPSDRFPTILATGNTVKQLTIKGQFVRMVWTIGGTTPNITFGVLFATRPV